MNNQDNRENNIVNPELVDLNKVQVDKQDNMLNRERSNIVSASIQANNAIDEKKALDVNNEIKIKKVNPIVKILVIIFAFILAGIGIYYAMKLVNKIMTYDDPVTTTTTKVITTPISKIANYTNNTNIIRKYQSQNHILLLAPTINDKMNYLYLEINEFAVLNVYQGTYNIIDEGINSDRFTLLYGENALLNGDERLEQFDTEFKAYMNKEKNKILIINGTPKYEYAMYIDNDIIVSSKFNETEESINLETGEVFTKNNMMVTINNDTLEYVY